MSLMVLFFGLVVQGQVDVDLGDSGFVRWEGAGFGAMEPGTVRYNENLPRENNVQTDEPYPIPVSQLTDGKGLVIRCKPGQGVVLHGRTIRSFWPVLVRIAAQAHFRSGRFTFSLGAVGPFGHVVTEQRNGQEFFARGWRTRSVVYNLSEIQWRLYI